MREQDLIQRVNRTNELLHEMEWLASDEHLYIIKGSWTDKTPWGVGVEERVSETEYVPMGGHPVLDKLPWNGTLGNSKREMGDALAVINSLLIAVIREKEENND